jgi:hypothetical protein
MSAQTPDRSDMQHVPDELDQAWADAMALADDGPGPALSVRANVLAAARELAARAEAAPPAPPALAPVAAPVAPVGRGRPWAVNLSSWRVRAGGAVFAVLLVAITSWRFAVNRLDDRDTMVASAALSVNVVPPPADRPPLPQAASPVMVPAPRADMSADVAAPAARAEAIDAATRPPVAREIAGADKRVAEPELPQAGVDRLAESAKAVAPPPVVVASPPAEPATVVAQAAASAPAPRARAEAAPARFAAAAPTQRVEITGASIARYGSAPVSDAARGSLDFAKNSAPAPVDSLLKASARAMPAPLQAAADRGDVEAIKRLLAAPATRVDEPDDSGRTALLHAVLAHQVAAVRALLDAGADPERADEAGLTPRAAAQAGSNAEIALLFTSTH